MNRITLNDIEAQLVYLNDITHSPERPYGRKEFGKWVGGGRLGRSGGLGRAQVGNYHLSQAYGGVCVHRVATEAGGITTPLSQSHISKRECYVELVAFIKGIEAGRTLAMALNIDTGE